MFPRPPASATAVPDMPAKMTEPTIFTCPKPSLHPTHQGKSEIIDPGRNSSGVHQAAGHDEKGDGEEGKGVCPADHPVENHEVGLNPLDNYIDEGGAGQRDGHGHPNGHKEEKTDEKSKGAH